MEDKFLKKIQNDLKLTKNPVIINNNDNLSKNNDNLSKNNDNLSKNNDFKKKNRFIEEISDSEDDNNEDDNDNYELKDEFREKVVLYVKSDDRIRELQKLVKEQQKIKKDSEEAILRHLERLGESMINISGGKIRKNQYESKGALKKEFIKDSILEKIKDPKVVEDILAKMEDKRETKINISLKRTFERDNKDGK
jgi:hypothetical protein